MSLEYKLLQQLAQLFGIQTSYKDVFGKVHRVSPEVLLAVLKARGAEIARLKQVQGAIRKRQLEIWERALEPVIVAWDNKPFGIQFRLPAEKCGGILNLRLQLENGATKLWQESLSALTTIDETAFYRKKYKTKIVPLPSLPYGYHKLEISLGSEFCQALIISSPVKSYQPETFTKKWGIFIPLYALHSKQSLGSGDFSDLKILSEWTLSLGGDLVATLPFLAGFLDKPFEYSPYLPASRLFWNEFYMDIRQIPEFQNCQPARKILESNLGQTTLRRLHSSPLVNYKDGPAFKHKILEKLSRYFFSENSIDQAEFWGFVKAKPEIENYARFWTVLEREKKPWPDWPTRIQKRDIKPTDHSGETFLYHLYVQWQAHLQIKRMAESRFTARLCLDFPLGVHSYSFDTWRFQPQFVRQVDAGAPPDAFFTRGQNWNFPPLSPEAMRTSHYDYLRACLQNVMQYACYLRIDHVMWLNRLFWIPKGANPQEGAYVCYPTEELYALFCLESHRHKCVLIGEDLGTVSEPVHKNMKQHHLLRMYVGQFENWQSSKKMKSVIPKDSVVSLNTHDMPTFAGFWKGVDLADRRQMGLLNFRSLQEERKWRLIVKNNLLRFLRKEGWLRGKTPLFETLKACLHYLSQSPARLLLINLEDLWLETRPQNVPGTGRERPNWRRKARYGLEQFIKMRKVNQLLRSVDCLRKK